MAKIEILIFAQRLFALGERHDWKTVFSVVVLVCLVPDVLAGCGLVVDLPIYSLIFLLALV